MNINFFKNIYKEDVIFHYTKTSIAIDYILYNHELRFSARQNSIDPIESSKANRRTVFTSSYIGKPISKKVLEDSNNLDKNVSNLENLFYQICFCKNNMGYMFTNENYHTQFNGNEEIFGFTKPRMWERYADNYTGVCLAFSKSKIVELNRKKFNLIENDINYLNFLELSTKKVNDISGDYLEKVGYDKYKHEIEKTLETSFFCKHSDYIGENEYRIGTYYDESKCSVDKIKGELHFDKTMMLDIKDCLEAIFISSYSNDNQKKSMLEYAYKLDVPIIEMEWKHNSFEVNDYKESVEMYNEILKS